MITSGIQPRAKNMKKNQTKTNDNGLKSLENKCGKNVIAQGWTGVPNTLIERQQALGLSSLDVNILLILLKYWWDADFPPYPSKRVIGEMVGKEESTIRRCMAGLERKGFIQRTANYLSLGGQSSNTYKLDGLVLRLEQEAKALAELKETRKEEDARMRRGTPIPTTKGE